MAITKPLRIRYSGSNFQDLIEMSVTDIKSILAYILCTDYATDASNLQATVNSPNVSTSGTLIGTFVDTRRVDGVGVYPTDSSTASTTHSFYQRQSAGSVSITNRAVSWDTTAGHIIELTDANYNTLVMDVVIADMVSFNQVGQYQIKSSGAPAGGTWVSRGTFTNTTDSSTGNTTTTYTLWQKTVLSSPPTSTANRPLKWNGTDGLKEMTDAEIKQATMLLRNRIISNSIGTYKVQASAPSPGTWVQMGDTATDTLQDVASVDHGGYFYDEVLGSVSTGGGGSVKLWLRTA